VLTISDEKSTASTQSALTDEVAITPFTVPFVELEREFSVEP